MTIVKSRWILFLIFIIFLLLAIALVAVVFIRGWIYPGSMMTVLRKLFIVYSVPLGVIIGGIFSQRKSQPKAVPPITFYVALISAVIWNLVVVWRVAVFSLSNDTVAPLTEYLDEIVPFTSFLVAGGLSYFFTKKQ